MALKLTSCPAYLAPVIYLSYTPYAQQQYLYKRQLAPQDTVWSAAPQQHPLTPAPNTATSAQTSQASPQSYHNHLNYSPLVPHQTGIAETTSLSSTSFFNEIMSLNKKKTPVAASRIMPCAFWSQMLVGRARSSYNLQRSKINIHIFEHYSRLRKHVDLYRRPTAGATSYS
ncbi:uncharacterized protein K460DRAFT_66967 [Cucurbitaria berberidis CBS 394.84]|uniref:Uncharacterized protein n=1 Tax=Cucurbitaria berberidis CBS 394.84 TaxID=1168544 RepID=A0A9P4GLT1_9PLEO|nr:uncharacterized protein K460DRAFT_66967 [Cucurbitaria berberidis CBS 394.84]KAF1848012.1 hypothetical protein K460DRAFT_66967 [Cucurbitaria berberidis CBS 394.84]